MKIEEGIIIPLLRKRSTMPYKPEFRKWRSAMAAGCLLLISVLVMGCGEKEPPVQKPTAEQLQQHQALMERQRKDR